MFEFILYSLAVLFVLWFVDVPAPTPSVMEQPEAIALSAALSQLWQKAKDESESDDLLEIGVWLEWSEPPAYDLDLPGDQLRALAEIYDIPFVQNVGQVYPLTLRRLAEVG